MGIGQNYTHKTWPVCQIYNVKSPILPFALYFIFWFQFVNRKVPFSLCCFIFAFPLGIPVCSWLASHNMHVAAVAVSGTNWIYFMDAPKYPPTQLNCCRFGALIISTCCYICIWYWTILDNILLPPHKYTYIQGALISMILAVLNSKSSM